MSSCVKPLKQSKVNPVVLLHGFDRFLSALVIKWFFVAVNLPNPPNGKFNMNCIGTFIA